jgi:hypothetical protein
MNDEMRERRKITFMDSHGLLLSVKGRLGSVGQGRGRPRE